MKIIKLDDKTVKIILTNVDMHNFNLSYDEMDYENPATKTALVKIINHIRSTKDMNLNAKKVYVEAYPYADGGSILYINFFEYEQNPPQLIANQQKNFNTPIIYRFESLDNLAKLAKRIVPIFGHIILKSSLFKMQNDYFLLIYTYCKMDDLLKHLLSEYGDFYGKGTIASAIIIEHGKLIIAGEKDALETINNCF